MSEKMFTRRQALIATTGAVAAAAVVSANPAQAEYQPAMEAALNALQNARQSLLFATPDKGGHRVIAIGHIDQAINHVQAGIAWDDVH